MVRVRSLVAFVGVTFIALSGCGGSFGHTPTPANLRTCLAGRPNLNRVTVDTVSDSPVQPVAARAVVSLSYGGASSSGQSSFDAALYNTYIYLFDSPGAAGAAAGSVHLADNAAKYVLGRGLIFDQIYSPGGEISNALPQSVSAAIRRCLTATGYLG